MFTSIRPSIRRLIRRIRTPSRWPWRSINITIIASICASSYITYYQYQRAQLKKEERRFNEGSPLQAIENSLETGDILLFNRSLFPWSSPSSNPPSLLPMRFLLVALQKLIVGSDWDHVAVIVRRNDYPYVLERGCNGKITVRLIESQSNDIFQHISSLLSFDSFTQLHFLSVLCLWNVFHCLTAAAI